MKFCKNCGHEVRDTAKICTNCGTAVTSEPEVKKDDTEYVTPEAVDTAPREPMDPEKKKKLIILGSIIAVVIIALIIVYKVLESMASPDSALDNISEAVESQDVKALQSEISTDISEEEALAYFSYIDSQIGVSQFRDMINTQKSYIADGAPGNVIHDGTHTLLSIEQAGSKYIFFDAFDFKIPKSNVYVNDHYGLTSFTYEFDGDTTEWDPSSDKFNELIPGNYHFEGTSIINETEEYAAAVNVNFADYYEYDRVEGFINADLYSVELYVPSLNWYDLDIESEDISLTINGEPLAEGLDLTSYPTVGPYKFDEEYVIEGSLDYGGETFNMESVTLNFNADSDELELDYASIPYHSLEVKFDEDALYEQRDLLDAEEQANENRESFEENMESNTEDLVRDYLNSLEYMYLFDDIGEVEPYIVEGAEVLTTLQSNLDNDNFGNMDIQRVSFSNYTKDENTISIDVETRRLHDDIEDPVTYTTQYTIQYNPDTLELKIVSFDDL